MASVDAMAARLASSLAIAEGKRPVDLRPSKGLRQPEVFMLGKLLTAREYTRRSFMGMFRSAWRVNGTLRVEEAGEDDRVLFSFTDPMDRLRVWKGGPWSFNRAPIALAEYDGVSPVLSVSLQKSSYWMTLMGVPPAFRSERIMRLIGSTIGEFMEFDRTAFRTRVLHIRVEIAYTTPLLLGRRFWVEDDVQFVVQFKYDKLFGRCNRCGFVTHVGLPCPGPELENEQEPVGTVAPPSALAVLRGGPETRDTTTRVLVNGQTLVFQAQVPRSIPEIFLPQNVVDMRRARRQVQIRELAEPRLDVPPITGVRRSRKGDEVTISPKKLRLSLAVGKKTLDAVTMGLVEAPVGDPEQPKRKRGRPVGSLNKMPYGTAGKSKMVKKDDDKGKKTKKNSKKTNLMPRLLAAADGVNSDPKGKELALV